MSNSFLNKVCFFLGFFFENDHEIFLGQENYFRILRFKEEPSRKISVRHTQDRINGHSLAVVANLTQSPHQKHSEKV